MRSRIAVGRLTLTGALSMLIIFAACWVGAVALNIPVTHMFIELFTEQPMTSLAALCIGGAWAFVWGAFAGAVVAAVYNLVGFMEGEVSAPAADPQPAQL